MTFRYARHTNNLNEIEKFYTEIIGLQKLGEFKNHHKYDGIFLGLPQCDWHLEFTTSDKKVLHQFDDDDILVFYLTTTLELQNLKEKLEKNHINFETPKNPYWKENGLMISDPDGHKIVLSVKKKE